MTTANKKHTADFDMWARKWKLDEEEREILASSERGEWKPLPKKEFEAMKKSLEASARHTLEKMKKTESISIRLTPVDLVAIKAKASKEGLPYQTLIGSIIHKYAHKE